MRQRKPPYNHSPRVISILLALMRALITEPEDLAIRDKEGALLQRCEIMLREMHPFNRFGFLWLLRLFNWGPLFFGFGFSRFVNLKGESQSAYVDRWLAMRSHFFKEIFKALRGMVMMAYFSHPDVWAYIGYDPRAHVEQRQALRRGLMSQNAVPSQNSGASDQSAVISQPDKTSDQGGAS